MIIIANPIYDVVFKYLMEDNCVAKILLSALLQKEVVELEVRPHEYSKKVKREISTFRIDFSAKIREKDGSEHLVLIELQKTWRATETLRFRQYLGEHYLDERNLLPKERNPKGYGLPIISIYLLDHRVGDLQEPVVYVRRRYLDYDSHPVLQGVPDPFVESLTHDAIIVQIPLLKGRARNHLERLLEVFDQNHRVEGDSHYLCIDEDKPRTPDEELVIDRLLRTACFVRRPRPTSSVKCASRMNSSPSSNASTPPSCSRTKPSNKKTKSSSNKGRNWNKKTKSSSKKTRNWKRTNKNWKRASKHWSKGIKCWSICCTPREPRPRQLPTNCN